ncbi:uncharacterized protein B0H18DRAFT_874204 [Fomitopsis serialis]|uniref:uncharacterized protein n=1 Tax=Fomitopsis serialis TaxID=139415 RepID=UPI002007FE6B|nr:uncharacterized protein B0H18DRAFT_874204 [Neoantrodia serialis]KAH9929219.1 hypothetical protein B0H18DRAFT_874204 [Neoantrodia serialis]
MTEHLDSSIREVRGIQVYSQDIEPLLSGKQQKVPGTTLNAFGAWLQDLAPSSRQDTCFLSSWLPSIVSGQVRSDAFHGSVEEHVLAAVRCLNRNQCIYGLTSRIGNRWAIPLCGGDPAHWVLGWVDFSSHQLGIYDSLPECDSQHWAEPLLLTTLDSILQAVGRPSVQWSSTEWSSFAVVSPDELQRQMDSWSCGHFTLLAMLDFAQTDGPSYHLGETSKEEARTRAFNALLSLRKRPIDSTPDASERTSAETGHPHQSDEQNRDSDESHETPDLTISSKHDGAERSACDRKKALDPPAIAPPKATRSVQHDETDIEDSDGDSTDREHQSKRRKQAARGPKLSVEERRKVLEDDEWVLRFDFHTVVCAGCRKERKLDKKRKYVLGNWAQHKLECEQITGKSKIRRAVISKKTTTPNKAITSFFNPMTKGERSTALMASARPGSAIGGVVSELTRKRVVCQRLRGEEYTHYLLSTSTRSLGGISFAQRSRIVRQLFPYKYPGERKVKLECPSDGNVQVKEKDWTSAEHKRLDHQLQGFARWIVDFNDRSIRSRACEGNTVNASGICDQCESVDKDESLRHAVRRAEREAQLPEAEREAKRARHDKHTPKTLTSTDARDLQSRLSDPVVRGMLASLEKNDKVGCFLQLYQQASEGKLDKYDTFTDICRVLSDRARRESHPDAKKLLHGMRYGADLWQFFTLMRSYGGNSAQQYSILAQELGFPSLRATRYYVKNSADVLQSGELEFENVARVKRFQDTFGYHGPVAVGSDCTKVRARLSYSNDYGSHILGSVLPLAECTVDDADDIDDVIKNIKDKKAYATQTRAIMIKIALPQVPPMVVALMATSGSDSAQEIHKIQTRLIQMAAQLKMSVIVCAADGAATELSAQAMMDSTASEQTPLAYEYTLYGLSLRAPVFKDTGPLISVQDPSHGRKTARNQPQHGTHTASLGKGYLVNRTLVQLYEGGGSGLQRSDIKNVDKQDDGAARRLFHNVALTAMTYKGDENTQYIKEEFLGLFVYLYVLGDLFDAWLCRRMSVKDRILAALRARSFLHIWRAHVLLLERHYPDLYSTARSFISPASFKIFNRLCDTLILLVLAYAQYYPDEPFCPWLLGTDFLEHFFGLARRMLPNFTYAELLKLVKHVMLRQKILLTRKMKSQPKPEREARAGYIFDFDNTPLSPEELANSHVKLSTAELNVLVELAGKEASQIAKQLLHMKIPKRPWTLPGSVGEMSSSSRKGKASGDGNDSDWESDLEEDLHDDWDNDADDVIGDAAPQAAGQLTMAVQLKDAVQHCARYAALCEDYDASVAELDRGDASSVDSKRPPKISLPVRPDDVPAPAHDNSKTASAILDKDGKISIPMMIRCREQHQSGTAVKSERVVCLDPKYSLSKLDDDNKKMSVKEASHRVRIVQTLHGEIPKEKTTREHRYATQSKRIQVIAQQKQNDVPNIQSKNISQINPLRPGCFVVVRNPQRTYIGEVLDIYKKVGSRHGSIASADSSSRLSGLSLRCFLPLENHDGDSEFESEDDDGSATRPVTHFSCHIDSTEGQLHTYARPSHVLYNLGTSTLVGPTRRKTFRTQQSSDPWHLLTSSTVQSILKGDGTRH